MEANNRENFSETCTISRKKLITISIDSNMVLSQTGWPLDTVVDRHIPFSNGNTVDMEHSFVLALPF